MMTRTATTTEARRSGRRRGLVLLLAAVAAGLLGVLLLSPGQAQAHDHEVPETVLKKGAKGLQPGIEVIESNWWYPSGDGVCANENASYVWDFPGADRVAAGSELRVRVLKTQRPDSFEIGAYAKVDENGQPTGEGRRLRRELEPVVRDGRTVAWDAVFSVGRPDRHYYLIGAGRWQDREGCGGADQYAYWGFHVRTRA